RVSIEFCEATGSIVPWPCARTEVDETDCTRVTSFESRVTSSGVPAIQGHRLDQRVDRETRRELELIDRAACHARAQHGAPDCDRHVHNAAPFQADGSNVPAQHVLDADTFRVG